MAQPVYKVFLVRRTEAAYQLSPEEQASLLQKVGEALDQVGGKRVVLCDSNWSSEEWPGFGVEVFPNIEAVQKHAQLLNQLNWYRYIESITVLGTETAM
jgi:hypothetical protein